jgi:hypothetical protein
MGFVSREPRAKGVRAVVGALCDDDDAGERARRSGGRGRFFGVDYEGTVGVGFSRESHRDETDAADI